MKNVKENKLLNMPVEIYAKIKSYEFETIKEFVIGFILGLFFSFYGFYFLNLFQKKKIKRKGVYYGCIVSIFVIIIFCTCFVFYCSYAIDINNRNLALSLSKNKTKTKKIAMVGFGDFVKSHIKKFFGLKTIHYVKHRKIKKKIV